MKLKSLRRLPMWLSISPWIVIALAVLLTGMVIIFSGHNASKAKEFAACLNFEKGSSIIRGFEAAINTSLGMRWTEDELLRLIEEMASQTDISYLAVTDQDGLVMASSDRNMTDKTLMNENEFAELKPSGTPQWVRHKNPDGSAFFLIYKEFKIADKRFRHPRHNHMSRTRPQAGSGAAMAEPPALPPPPPPGAPGFYHGRQCRWLPPENPDAGQKRVIVVAYNAAVLEEALAVDKEHMLLMSWILFVLAFAGMLSLFLVHNYVHSRKVVQEMRAFSMEVTDNLPLGIISTDSQGRVSYANPEALKISCSRLLDVLGQSPAKMLGQVWEHISSSLKGGQNLTDYETWILGGGRRTPVSLSASRIVTEEGNYIANAIIMRDLGEVRKLQSEVRRRDRLVSLGNMAAGVAHELRNPLSSIKGLARFFIEQNKSNAPVVKAGEIMTQEIERLDRVVSGLLDLARPDKLILKETGLAELVEGARRLAESDLKAKNIAFKADLNYPGKVALDSDRMIQALLNLFLNAVQAMETGGSLSVRAAEEGENLLIEVSDTGKGMDAEQISQIFSPYFTTKASGAGLGLALVHKIVEAHDGGIEAHSSLGKGAVFTIRIPQSGVIGV